MSNKKLRIYIKDPDGFHESIDESVRASLPRDLDDRDELDMLYDNRIDLVNTKLSKWVKYGELVALEYDPDADTLTVLRQEDWK